MDWQEEYQQKRAAINRLKKKYYDFEEKLALPHHSRYYYDWLSSRSKSLPMDEKLADLGFLVTQGFDLQQSVSDYKVDRDENITKAIPQTFRQYIRVYISLIVCKNRTRKNADRTDLKRILFRHVGMIKTKLFKSDPIYRG